MSEMNYASNSKKAKEEEEKKADRPEVEQVVKGSVVVNKKSNWGRIKETFFVEDNSSVVEYLIFDVVIPNTKTLIMDLLGQGIERKFYGGGTRGSSGTYLGRGSSRYTNYSKVTKTDRVSKPVLSSRERETHDFENVVLESRGEAELILDSITDLIVQYDVASVSDLYKALGVTPSFQDEKWGWTDMRGAAVRPTRGGYSLALPSPKPLD